VQGAAHSSYARPDSLLPDVKAHENPLSGPETAISIHMSGLEIAGLVIGAFPLVLKVLEKYQEVGRAFNFWWEIRREFGKCRRDIIFHQLMFRANLKQLLLPLAIDDDTIERMLESPGGKAWSDQQILLQLKSRLSDSYELYIDIVEAMERTMKDVENELALDKNAIQDRLVEPSMVRNYHTERPTESPLACGVPGLSLRLHRLT
jgi:hypothetical protein